MAEKNRKRIIIYYQTLIDLTPLISVLNKNSKQIVTDITLASIHFGVNADKTPYIHLNDNSPNSSKFQKVFSQLREIKNIQFNGEPVKVNLLIGGAGTAFNNLFSNYNTYYNLLKVSLENELDFIDGFNLDIEEEVNIDNIINLVNDLKRDFPSKSIVFAPLAGSLSTDEPGMGGFSYKELDNKIGSLIDYYNVQCYGEYSEALFKQITDNGYPPEKIVMGMLTGQDLNGIINQLETIVNDKTGRPTNTFGGVAVWEYFNAPPSSPDYPYVWCEIMYHILSNDK